MSDKVNSLKRNNISLPMKDVSIKRKEWAGTIYPTVAVPETRDGLINVIDWLGVDVAQGWFQRTFNAIAQKLFFDASEVDDKNPDGSDKSNPTVVSTNWEKFQKAFEELTTATGESIPVLEERKEELTGQIPSFLAKLKSSNPADIMAAGMELAKITEAIQNINKQIEDRKEAYANVGRGRKPKVLVEDDDAVTA